MSQAQAAALPFLNAESSLARFLAEIRRFPLLEPQEEFMLAKRWRELLNAFSGGDREMEASAAKMYRQEPQVAQQYGLDQEMFRYIGEAMKA